MADENEFGAATEINEDEMGEGLHVVDVDEEVEDDTLADDLPVAAEEEEQEESEIDPEEEEYFYGEDKGFDAR